MRKSSEKVVAQLIKNLPAMRDTWVRSAGEGNGYPLQYSGLKNSMDYSMGSQRIRHNWAALNKTNAFKMGSVGIFQQPGAFKLYFDQGFSWFLRLIGLLLSFAFSWLTTPWPAVKEAFSPSPSFSSSSFSLTEIVYITPGGSSGKESASQCRRYKRLMFNSWVWKIPWSRKWQLTPVFLFGKSMDTGAW